ncbi:hypothetical protein IWQ62_005876 [Dispira parvispora]|uniref:Uncharacterized protein n=1 Tax=Dispira parvispora TaxID=1520584 RepID=A0A9W8AJ51_9FUNG|nr:hypothetical protein IWQ62_005876 [Dispira parvispora]
MNLQRRSPNPFLGISKAFKSIKGLFSKEKKPSAKKDATNAPKEKTPSTGKDAANPSPNNPSSGKDATNSPPNSPQSAPRSADGVHPPESAVPGAAASAATSTPGKIGWSTKINYIGAGATIAMLPGMIMGSSKDKEPTAEAASAESIPATNPPPTYTSQDLPPPYSSQDSPPPYTSQDPPPPNDGKFTQQGYTNPSQQLPSANQPAQPDDVKGTAYVDPSVPQYNANQQAYIDPTQKQYYASHGNPIMTSGTTVLA